MTTTGSELARPDAARPTHRMLIGPDRVDAENGAVLDSVNPSTGQTFAHVPAGEAIDVDRAVAAARSTFEGAYSRVTPVGRRRLLNRLADLIEAHYDELRTLDALDMGQPVGARPATAEGVADVLRYFAGWSDKITGDTVPNSLPARSSR